MKTHRYLIVIVLVSLVVLFGVAPMTVGAASSGCTNVNNNYAREKKLDKIGVDYTPLKGQTFELGEKLVFTWLINDRPVVASTGTLVSPNGGSIAITDSIGSIEHTFPANVVTDVTIKVETTAKNVEFKLRCVAHKPPKFGDDGDEGDIGEQPVPTSTFIPVEPTFIPVEPTAESTFVPVEPTFIPVEPTYVPVEPTIEETPVFNPEMTPAAVETAEAAG